MAEEGRSAEAKRLRLSEARDWFALAAAHDQDLSLEDDAWSPLDPLDRARRVPRDGTGTPGPEGADGPI